MKTNSIYKTSLLAAALLLAATSCVKDELHDTPHPDYGKITVTADWTDRGDGVDIPAEWTVAMGDYAGTETGKTHAPDYLFEPGSYTLAAYNTPEDITISGTTATITGTPGWLFTSVQEVTVEADTPLDGIADTYILSPDDDLERAISAEKLLTQVKADLHAIFQQKHK